jgi:hypothetical protein
MNKRDFKVPRKRKIGLYLVLGIPLLLFFMIQIRSFARTSNVFTIKNVQITGNENLSREYLRTVAEHFIGKNIVSVDRSEVVVCFMALPRVKEVSVKKVYPAKLRVRITERQGLFFVKLSNGDFFPIDSEKYVLDKADWYLFEDIPLININLSPDLAIVGEQISDDRIDTVFLAVSRMSQQHPNFLNDISEFYFRRNDLYFIDNRIGCRVLINLDNIETQITRFIFLRENQNIQRNKTIDLRFENQIVIS